jgi:hypothetical protein
VGETGCVKQELVLTFFERFGVLAKRIVDAG